MNWNICTHPVGRVFLPFFLALNMMAIINTSGRVDFSSPVLPGFKWKKIWRTERTDDDNVFPRIICQMDKNVYCTENTDGQAYIVLIGGIRYIIVYGWECWHNFGTGFLLDKSKWVERAFLYHDNTTIKSDRAVGENGVDVCSCRTHSNINQ